MVLFSILSGNRAFSINCRCVLFCILSTLCSAYHYQYPILSGKDDLQIKDDVGVHSITIIGIYSTISLQTIGEPNFEFYYGMAFVTASSIVLALALLSSLVFRGGVLGIAWVLMLLGLFLTNVGDVWYFYLETFNAYVDGHPVELLWYSGYWVITYGLYKHKKII